MAFTRTNHVILAC